MFNADFFHEHQKALLGFLNSNIGGAVRRSLWIPEYKNLVVKLTPNAAHVILPNGSVKAVLYSNKQYSQALHRNYKPLWEALHWWDMKLANKFLPAWNAGFDSYSSQPNETSGIDTYIYAPTATTNFGTDVDLYSGELTSGASRFARILIKFDITSIPSNALTSSNIFSLWIISNSASNARDHKIFRLLRDWVESQATWNIWKTSNNWTTAGAGSDGNDADLTNVWATTNIAAAPSAGTEIQWSLSTTEFDKFLNGTYTNYGWLIKADTETDDAHEFDSSGSSTATKRPKLQITYLPSSGGNFFPYF